MTIDEVGRRVPDSELDYDEELVYRWQGALFTGVGFDEMADGVRSEVSYRYGLRDGPARDWYPSGALKAELWFRENVHHGMEREYDECENLLREGCFEYGILVSRAERDDQGNMAVKFRIDPDSKNYEILDRYRREKGWPA